MSQLSDKHTLHNTFLAGFVGCNHDEGSLAWSNLRYCQHQTRVALDKRRKTYSGQVVVLANEERQHGDLLRQTQE